LILTADDFGASKNINEGIALAVEKKIITSISALTNFPESLTDLKRISENHPNIGIGVHLNITTGHPVLGARQVPSLVSPSGNFYTVDELSSRIRSISLEDLRKELRAQIIALIEKDISVDHLSDQNGVLSLYGPFFEVLIELATEFNVPIRTPIVADTKYPEIFTNSQIKKHSRQIASQLFLSHPFKALRLKKHFRIKEMEKKEKKLNDLGIIHPDVFIMSFWGDPTTDNFFHIIENLPKGVSEIVLHLGTPTRQDSYPNGLDLAYFENREYELMTLTDDSVRKHIDYLNIRTIGYSEIFISRNK
jgi:predicted glycoside hydrolase/deacetylase ChbG (UPF0249 family)